jgi:SAM-dependent methyltransferase
MYLGNAAYYQPSIDGVITSFKRPDTEQRYEVIVEHIEDIKGMSLIDIGCANGYFPLRFVKDGGNYAYGVEIDVKDICYIRETAKEKDLNVEAGPIVVDRGFDIGIYLDLHYHDGSDDTDYLEYLRDHCSLVFTSPSGLKNNMRYLDKLKEFFKCITSIHTGYAGRAIYKCQS